MPARVSDQPARPKGWNSAGLTYPPAWLLVALAALAGLSLGLMWFVLHLLSHGESSYIRETPYLWIDSRPDGGACYVVRDTLGPCFEKPRTDEPSP